MVGSGVPLGIQPDSSYSQPAPVQLDTGDLVILMTDGIEEAIAPDESVLGTDRVLDVVISNRHRSAASIIESLYGEVRRFTQTSAQMDDATILIIRVL